MENQTCVGKSMTRKKMKIGILTFHRADNFGALLQAYALTSYLRGKGYDVEIIDFRCKKIEAQYHVFCPQILLTRKNVFVSMREYVERYKNVRDRMVRRRKIKQFREEYLPMSASFHSISQPLQYDIIIAGSDQVWNFHLNKGSEKYYLLDFPVLPNTRRVAYAASSEQNGMANMEKTYLAHCLERFDKISVRESFIKDDFQKLVRKKVEICLDPTFLLSKEQYEHLAVMPKRPKYVLVYYMTYAPEVLPLARKIAKEKNAELVELFGSFIKRSDAYHITDWSPVEVLGYIAGSEKVFTSSFHGLALSLILRKDVWVVNKGSNLRQKNLLKLTGLSHRLLSDVQDYNEIPIDYKKVETHLRPAIDSSKEFLNFSE